MMLWKCPKCKQQWQQIIEKCPYCFSTLLEKKPESLKVIGSTKCFLQSKQHPIVPYNILLLEDNEGNRFSKKTSKNYKTGEKYPKACGKEDVIVQRVKYDLEDVVSNCFALAGKAFESGSEVLVNSGLMAVAKSAYARERHKSVIFAAMAEIKKNSGEKSFSIALPKKALENKKLVRRLFGKDLPEKTCFVTSEESLDQKFKALLNLPVPETHDKFFLKAASLNLLNLGNSHNQKTALEIKAVAGKFKSIFSLCDGTVGLHGNNFNRELGHWEFLASSQDFVALDAVLCRAFSMPLPAYLKETGAKGLGKTGFGSIAFDKGSVETLNIDASIPFKAEDYSGLKEKLVKKVLLWKMKK